MEKQEGKEALDAWCDPIVREVHAVRERRARAFNYDIEAMVDDLKRRQRESSRQVVSFPPKRVGEAWKEEGLA